MAEEKVPAAPSAAPACAFISLPPKGTEDRKEQPAPAAMWRNGAYAGEFGDAFIADTELEGGQVAPSITILLGVVRDAVIARRGREAGELTAFDPDVDFPKIERICADLEAAAERDNAVSAVGPHRKGAGLNNAAFALLLKTFVNKIAALEPGARIVVSGGWARKKGGHAVMHVV